MTYEEAVKLLVFLAMDRPGINEFQVDVSCGLLQRSLLTLHYSMVCYDGHYFFDT